ncbi:MAG: hypothetical protein ACYTGQ_09690, partial [Planctomycetota bacterium]
MRNLRQLAAEYRCLTLLATLVFLLLAYPYLGHSTGRISFPGQVLLTVVLVTSVWAVGRKRRHVYVALALAVPAFFGNWIDLTQSHIAFAIVTHGALVAFYLATTTLVLSHIFSGWAFAGDKLMGGLAAYLLIGLAFTWIYEITYLIDPAAFTFNTDNAPI